MKSTLTIISISLVISGSFSSPALAQVDRLRVRQVDNGGEGDLAGTVTNDVAIDFLGELRGQQILLELTRGNIYQDSLGSNLPPEASLVSSFRDLMYDTFLTMGGVDSASSEPVLEVGRIFNLGLDPQRPSFGPDFIDAAWAPATGVMILNRNDFLTARITLTDDAVGTWQYLGTVADSEEIFEFTSGRIVQGLMIVPEPASAIIAGAAMLSGIRVGRRPSPSLKGATR